MTRKISSTKNLYDELPSIFLLILCYSAYAAITILANTLGTPLSIALLSLVLVLHSSLQHEFIHGHPTSNQFINDALVSLPIGLYLPYLRFKDTHLAHHHDQNLTDPYDDPESNFYDPIEWHQLPKWRQYLCNFNNTLFGRMVVGPFLGTAWFYSKDIVEIYKGNWRILSGYIYHFTGLIIVAMWFNSMSTLPVWAYLLAAYLALSILRIRTFLEHQAHDKATSRTVLIEDKGLLSLLFLNNNYHSIHHSHPQLVWHRLPQKFKERRDKYLGRYDSYWFQSYWDVFRLYFFNRKDPVPHPLRSGFIPSDNVHSTINQNLFGKDETPNTQTSEVSDVR